MNSTSANATFEANLPPGIGQFSTTHWSVVVLAGHGPSSKGDAALELLCGTYWPPLYAYVRRRGYSPHDAQDLTQNFFARMLEKKYLGLASQERGKFRSFLLKSLNHFLVNDYVRNHAQKRGGVHEALSLDEEGVEQMLIQEKWQHLDPEAYYDKRWAVTLVANAMERLGKEYAAVGKRELFECLRGCLSEEATGEVYRRIGEQLGMSVGAVKVAVHRLRVSFRTVVCEEVAQTVADPGEVDGELSYLMAVLGS